MKTKKTLLFSNEAVVIFAAILLLHSLYAIAQNSNKSPLKQNLPSAQGVAGEVRQELKHQQDAARLTRYEVKAEYQKQFQKVLSAYVLNAITSESNIMAEGYYETENPYVLWLIERWDSKNDLDNFGSNSKSKAVRSLTASALSTPAKEIYIQDLEPISKQQWRRTSKAVDSQLTIMLFVDAKPGTQANFKDVYHTAMPQFRSEPGVVTYQLSQLEEDETQFVTYEKFRSNEAFQYHLTFPPIKPVIDYLNSSIKKQPFQDAIHSLVEFAPLIRE